MFFVINEQIFVDFKLTFSISKLQFCSSNNYIIMKNLYLTKSSQVALKEILYLKSDENYTAIYTTNQERLMVARTLRVMQERIEDTQSFIRINNNHVVNISFMNGWRKDDKKLVIILEDGQEFVVSRRRISDFREAIRKSPKAILLKNNKVNS